MVAGSFTIRDAVEQDVPGILAIYNDVIATSTAVYRDDPASLADRLEWFNARRAQACPILVAAGSERR
jgi:phosphinothricin acetyltransferase